MLWFKSPFRLDITSRRDGNTGCVQKAININDFSEYVDQLKQYLFSYARIISIIRIFGLFLKEINIPIEKLQVSGPGLVLITIPTCILTMVYPNLWMDIFFFTLI